MSGCFRIKDINQVVEKMSMKYTYEAMWNLIDMRDGTLILKVHDKKITCKVIEALNYQTVMSGCLRNNVIKQVNERNVHRNILMEPF